MVYHSVHIEEEDAVLVGVAEEDFRIIHVHHILARDDLVNSFKHHCISIRFDFQFSTYEQSPINTSEI